MTSGLPSLAFSRAHHLFRCPQLASATEQRQRQQRMELADRGTRPKHGFPQPHGIAMPVLVSFRRVTPHGETVPDSPSVPDHRPSTISMPWRIPRKQFWREPPGAVGRKKGPIEGNAL